MKRISDANIILPTNKTDATNTVDDNAPAPGYTPPTMHTPAAKSHPMGQAASSEASTTHRQASEPNILPSSKPIVSPRDPVTASHGSSPTTNIHRQVDEVNLANHVSLQIFSTDSTRNNKNVILFLHGGPGLAYDNSFENLTSWSLEHGYTLVAPEIAGSSKPGLSDTSDSFSNPPNYVNDLGSVIQYLRQQEDFKGKEFCAVAHSWGGFQLASMLTDQSISSEDKNFFKQVVFMSPNLDSAQTRIFAMYEQNGFTNEFDLQNEMARRHAGSKSNSTDKINFVKNPVMNKNLNEEVSPFYRLDKMPKDVSYLFVHPTKDKNVPASQSLASVEKINSNAGNAKIVMPTCGEHGFFKTGTNYNSDAMSLCFGAIDSLIKNPDSLQKINIDGDCFDSSDSENIDSKIKEKDDKYENHKKLLDEWHDKGDAEKEMTGKNKIQVLMKIKAKNEGILKNLADRNLNHLPTYKKVSDDLSMVNEFLKEQ